MYFEDRHLDTMDFVRDAFRDDLSLCGGLLADECAALYVGPDEEVPQAEQFNRCPQRAGVADAYCERDLTLTTSQPTLRIHRLRLSSGIATGRLPPEQN